MPRIGKKDRQTKETSVEVVIDLEGSGRAEIDTGLPFLDHMLNLTAAHGIFDLKVKAEGDLEIDGHHTAEDIGLTLGQALDAALGDKAGITRYGSALVPMDETLARAVIDLSGRAHLSLRAKFRQERVGEFECDLVYDFFQALATEARLTLHLDAWHARSDHHQLEALFKAFGRALGQAVTPDPRRSGIPSTKGVL